MNPEEKDLVIELLATDSIIREIENTNMYTLYGSTLHSIRTDAHELVAQLDKHTDIMLLVDIRREAIVQKYRLR